MTEVIYEIPDVPDDCTEMITRAAEYALSQEGARGSVSVAIVGPEEIQRLNREFRKIDSVTDVLTFPAWEGEEIQSPSDGYLGDIAICYQRAVKQAEEYGHSIEREISFLTIHGILHILGYDHMDEESEKVMFQRQNEILRQMGVNRE